MNNGGDFVFLSGAAIQEVVASPAVDLDFGDAPTGAQSGYAASYPVTLADDGARHTPTGPTLGAARDAEADGVPSTAADGDDLADSDDEEGVVFSGLGVSSTTAAVNIMMGNVVPAKVDAWIDFNRDGDWDDAGEKILDSVDVSNAMQTLNYAVPAGITAGDTYARVRLSTAGGLSPTGLAADGEVEDHLITIGPPQVESVVINGGDPQRSGITSVQVTFDRVVDIDFSTGDVFEFVNTTTSQTVTDFSVVTEVDGKTVLDLTFVPGPSVNPGGGLNDGDYVLTIDADRVSSQGDPLDGDGNGTPGDDYVFGASAVDNFYRKYGDYNGNGTVELFDFAAFRSVVRQDGWPSRLPGRPGRRKRRRHRSVRLRPVPIQLRDLTPFRVSRSGCGQTYGARILNSGPSSYVTVGVDTSLFTLPGEGQSRGTRLWRSCSF